jgi:hypothetical protein
MLRRRMERKIEDEISLDLEEEKKLELQLEC